MRLLLACLAGLMFLSFQLHPKNKTRLPKEFVKIPAGTITLTDSTNRITLMEFYMSRYEVSNAQYRQFYNEASPAMTEPERTRIASDSTGWLQPALIHVGMARSYFS